MGRSFGGGPPRAGTAEEEKRKAAEAKKIADSSCDDLIALEAPALMGKVTKGQETCLEKRLSGGEQLTMKDKISKVLIANAEGKGDRTLWEKRVSYHLRKIGKSDPNLCMGYSIQMYKKKRYAEAIKWSETALENKRLFQGTRNFQEKVYTLYKIRARAASKLYTAAGQKALKAGEGDTKAQAEKEKYKGKTKNFSREWLLYAKSSKQEIKEAMQMCVSAADVEFCK